MKGLVFAGDRKIEFRDFPDPTPGQGEVVIEMKASGMCGSDLKFYRPPAGAVAKALGLGDTEPVIGGHEPAGMVVAVGPGVDERQARIGDRVMVHHYRGCGACSQCGTGWMQLCTDQQPEVYGATGHGSHAPFMKCLARMLVPLREELSFEAGAAISCGTGTAWGALQRLGLQGDHTVAIFGQGPVGLSATQLASAMGARVIALDISNDRLNRAKDFGADVLINPSEAEDVVGAIKDVTHGLGAHASVEASGVASARRQAVQTLRTWGKSCYVGEGGDVTLDVSTDLIRRQITLIASWSFSTIGQKDCADFIADRKIDVDSLFTHRWQLDQAAEAYAVYDKQSDGKGVFLL